MCCCGGLMHACGHSNSPSSFTAARARTPQAARPALFKPIPRVKIGRTTALNRRPLLVLPLVAALLLLLLAAPSQARSPRRRAHPSFLHPTASRPQQPRRFLSGSIITMAHVVSRGMDGRGCSMGGMAGRPAAKYGQVLQGAADTRSLFPSQIPPPLVSPARPTAPPRPDRSRPCRAPRRTSGP